MGGGIMPRFAARPLRPHSVPSFPVTVCGALLAVRLGQPRASPLLHPPEGAFHTSATGDSFRGNRDIDQV
jgi:hypothetical protein